MSSVLKTINLGNYFRLVHELLPGVEAVSARDVNGEFFHDNDSSKSSNLESVYTTVIEDVQSFEQDISHQILSDGDLLYIVQLKDLQGSLVGQLIVLLNALDMSGDTSPLQSVDSSLLTIAELAQHEIELNTELNMMSEELTERYEELNLVYDYDPSRALGNGGEASLEYLVKSCTNFLNVAMSALILPDQNIAIYDYAKAGERVDPSIIIPSLNDEIYNWLRDKQQTIVINGFGEKIREECCDSLPYKLVAAPVYSGQNNVIGAIVILKQQKEIDFTNSDKNLLDVMSKKTSNIVIECFDQLTGLNNAGSIQTKLDIAVQQAQLKGLSHALIHIDIDKLQVINDVSGRQAGDELIRHVANIIRHLVRNRDSVARLASDKFVVLLEDCPIRIAIDLAQKIRAEIKAQDFKWNEKSHDISVSIGIAPISPKTESASAALSTVEGARDAAKERGRNQLKVFEQDDVDLLLRRDEMRWVSRIQGALRENRFVIYAQLIEPFQEEEQYPHYEILLRMRDEEGKIVPPNDFLPAAEHYSLMPDIDRWVIENTFDLIAENPCHVSINLSGQSLCNEGFLDFVVAQLQRGSVQPGQISFEVTETATIANINEAKLLISALKTLGSTFSLDDFGTGLSSFSYLKNMDVDYLKIDGSFIREIESDAVSEVMVKAIHEVGKAIGLKTIAEFVENDVIKNQLVSMGIDYGQGYGLGKPEPLTDILKRDF
jgi:diguanylate cyclase (GGDEF)-like protein